MGKINSKSLKLVLTILVCLVFLLNFMAIAEAQSNSDQYKPYLHKPTVKDTPELKTFGQYQTQLFPGAGTYTYVIETIPGTNGLQPLISLFYNSQSTLQRPGILGSGWSLTEGSIIRNVNHTLNKTSDDFFILSLGDNNFKVFYNGTNFNTELDPRKFKIQNFTNNGKVYWNVTSVDGTKYRFGFSNNSLLESNNGYTYDLKWSLDLVEDVHGNKIFYSYREDPFSGDIGTVYLSNISYNNDLKRLITFEYESNSRPDRRLVYEQGNKLDESRRLTGISVFYDGSLVRRYSLGYTTLNSEKSMSAIANISYIGADNSSILNTIKLEYYNTTQGFDNVTGKWIVPESFAFSSTDTTQKDFGVRFIDVNNDGFPDLLKSKAGSNETKLNNKTSGWSDTTQFKIPVDIVDSNNIDQGVRFEDVNSDGLVDILKAKSGSSRAVYLNNGTGWIQNSTLSIPLDFIDSNSNELGVELVDLNGDGKVDILKANSSTKATYLNNGSGWQSTSEFVSPDVFITSSNNDNGLRIIDLNNDGLPDLLKGGTPGGAWLNNGTGWVNNSGFAPNLQFTDTTGSRPDLGVRFLDINGDGLIDILQNFLSNVSYINATNGTEYNITSATDAKLNNGTGWTQTAGWLSPERFTDQGFNIGRRIADVNGDGYADIIRAYSASPYQGVTNIRNATNAFLLKKITNAYGGITEVSYRQSTLSNNDDDLGFNIWLVANTSLNNSMNEDFNAGSQYSYLYSGGKYDYGTQEFMGFARVNETLPDNSITAHFFHQDSILKGREFRTVIYDPTGRLFIDTLNNFTSSVDKMIFLNKTSTLVYDGESTPIINNITYSYDAYGNVKSINNSGVNDISGDEKFERFEYSYNTSTYVVNRPVNYTLFDTDFSSVLKRTFYFYDNLTSGITRGDLTKVRNYNNLGTNPEHQYSYDSFGNVIKETQPLGYNTTYTYDSTGTYKVSETNQLGHTINYGYNLGTGNLLFETRHGLNKTYTYDTFGRIKTEIISPDTTNSPTKNYTYTLDGLAPEIIKIQNKNNVSDYSEELYFYDGFSNVVQIKTLLDGRQIVKNYFYDSKYRVDEEQNPYFDSYTSSLSAVTNDSKIQYKYDALDRVVNLTKQDNSSLIVVFNKTTVTQYDENSNRIDYVLDGLDRIRNVKEYETNSSGTFVYTTNYTYRTDDTLIKIIDSKENKFLFGYDSLGRKTVYDDPNMNNWTYSYDLNGNLVNQTDGRNITTFLTYDSINRVTLKRSGSSNVSFVYDGQLNGTLTNLTSDSNYFSPFYIRYKYDDRLRINKTETFVCYREVNPGSDECELVNVSIVYDSQDRVLNMYLPNANLNYNYNEIGKLESMNDFLDSVKYNAFGKISNKTYSNSLITKMNYDTLGRTSRIQTDSLQNLSYIYDPVGNVLLINDTKNSKSYSMSYDGLNRLTSANITDLLTQATQRFRYNYNSIGNLMSMSTNQKNITYSYSNLAHAPTNMIKDFVDCAVITAPNTLHILESNVSSAGTCIEIQTDNVTIDGMGHTIFYAQSTTGYGVLSSGNDNIVIKNLNIINNRTTSTSSPGIEISNGVNLNVTNVYLNISGRTSSPDSNNYGIFVSFFARNVSISDSRIITNNRGGRGVYVDADDQVTSISIINTNITTYNGGSNGADGINLNGISGLINDTKISKVVINTQGASSPGISITGSTPASSSGGRTNMSNVLISTQSASSSCGILLTEVKENSYIRDSNISASNDEDICIFGSSLNKREYNLLNVTYVDEIVSNGKLIRKWYYRAYVNDTSGNNVAEANISAFNVTNNFQFNLTSGSDGFTSLGEIIDHINSDGTKSHYSNYTVYASHLNYSTISHQLNITQLMNVYFDIFTFILGDTVVPQISYGVGTQADEAVVNASSIYVNVSVIEENEEEIVFSLYNMSVPKSNLVAWYGFEHNLSNQIDNSANGIYATVGNSSYAPSTAPVFTTDGKIGSAYEFDGDLEMIESASSTPFDLNDSATYTVWIRPKMNTTETRRVISKSNSGATAFGGFSLLYPASTRPQCSIANLSGTSLTATASSNAALNNWSFVSCVVRRTGTDLNISIYLNGVLESSSRGTVTGEIYNSTYKFRIGMPPNSNNFGEFNGTIDEVRVYNTNLSSSQISEIYNSRLVNKTTSTTEQRKINWTSLNNGNYYYNVFVSDESGNQNITATRSIILNYSAPYSILQFVPPTPSDGSTQSGNSIFVNMTANYSSGHYVFVNLDRTLEAWITFDNNDSFDIGPGELEIIRTGNVSQSSGNFNRSINISSNNSYVSVPFIFDAQGNYTFTLWMKLGSPYPFYNGLFSILEQDSGFSVGFFNHYPDLQFCFGNNQQGVWDKCTSQYNYACIDEPDSVWCMVAITYNDGNFTTYSNTGTNTGSVVNTYGDTFGANLDVGKVDITNGSDSDSFYKGQIDDLIIFSRILAPSEIKSLYSASSTKYQNNFTGLAAGEHIIRGHAMNKSGDSTQTELRTITLT